jgi:anti-sigma factor RsiW
MRLARAAAEDGMATAARIAEEELQAYVDGRLAPDRQAAVEHHLAEHPDESRRVASWLAQKEALRIAFVSAATDPVPPELSLAHLLEARLRRRVAIWPVAAGVALALCVGAAGGWYVQAGKAPDRTQLAVSLLEQQALASHTVYAVDRRHPIEVPADQSDHLAQWLSNRLHRTVAAPDLAVAGYRLIGGRLLATEHAGAAALFMYENGQGDRLSVIMRPMAPEIAAYRTDEAHGAVNLCAWIDRGIGYAVVAAAPDATLDAVAREINQQRNRG